MQKYDGEGKPPFCEMLLTPQPIKLGQLRLGYVKPKEGVTFSASVTGIKPSNEFNITRAVEPFKSHNNTITVISGQL